jgi:oxygen-independent coproporphyrinogen-3 oxidase
MITIIDNKKLYVHLCKMQSLFQKYNVPGPRYTSYPTVPYWKNGHLSRKEWIETVDCNQRKFQSQDISLYIHLPFCESLCTFCGCHKRITKNHAVEIPYIDSVLKEWKLYQKYLPFQPKIKELHFGGGTPTFFRIEELLRLLNGLFQDNTSNTSHVHFSFEAHPNNTSDAHLAGLYKFGFRRMSLGVQDYNPKVQQAIHRIQPFSQVKKVHESALQMAYTSINHDLVFGLPKQQLNDIVNTVNKTIELMPHRIALYGYAHVPWIKGNGQRGFCDDDIPKDEEKRRLYEVAKQMLLDNGYIEIGMDHFALPHDELAIAFRNNALHRNFMGYTTQHTSLLLGLGMSAISDSWFGFAQNKKDLEAYQLSIENDEIPIFRGHILNDEDLILRQAILDLMCKFETTLNVEKLSQKIVDNIFSKLNHLQTDQLIEIEGNTIRVHAKGIPFVRNVCMAFDQYLQENEENRFSKTI